MFSGLKAWVKKTIQANTNLSSHNIKRLVTNEAANVNMLVADQIEELGVDAWSEV